MARGARTAVASAAVAAVAAALLSRGASAANCEAVPSAEGSCTWSCNGASYDMSVFRSEAGHRVLDSQHNLDSKNYTYVFNVCGDLSDPPNSHTDNPRGFFGNNCNITHGNKDHSTLEGPAPAFQVSNTWGFCYRLGDSYKSSLWSLYDEQNPARGAMLTYTGGNTCDNGKERSLKVTFICGQVTENPFATPQLVVEEVDDCAYEVITESTYGCPQECPVVNNKVCSGKGVCDYDTDQSKARCFCQPGYTGGDCGTKIESGGLDAVGGVLIFVCILLVALFGILVYLWNKIRTLRLDPKAYSVLRGGAGEDGSDDI